MGSDIFGAGSHSAPTDGGGFNDPDKVRVPTDSPRLDTSPIIPAEEKPIENTLYAEAPITPVDSSLNDALNTTKNNETRDISRKRYDNVATSSKRSTLLTGLLGLSDQGLSGTKKSLLGL